MRAGTFVCWLFGHKFVGHDDFYEHGQFGSYLRVLNWCIRCGQLRSGAGTRTESSSGTKGSDTKGEKGSES